MPRGSVLQKSLMSEIELKHHAKDKVHFRILGV